MEQEATSGSSDEKRPADVPAVPVAGGAVSGKDGKTRALVVCTVSVDGKLTSRPDCVLNNKRGLTTGNAWLAVSAR